MAQFDTQRGRGTAGCLQKMAVYSALCPMYGLYGGTQDDAIS